MVSPFWIRLRQPHGNALPRDGIAQPGLLHASASSFQPGACAAAVDVSCGGLRPNCVSLYARALHAWHVWERRLGRSLEVFADFGLPAWLWVAHSPEMLVSWKCLDLVHVL
jgi:hypothetical protein